MTDEFTRHDFLQSSGEIDLVNLFCDILECMAKLDILIDNKYKNMKARLNMTRMKMKRKKLENSRMEKIYLQANQPELVLLQQPVKK